MTAAPDFLDGFFTEDSRWRLAEALAPPESGPTPGKPAMPWDLAHVTPPAQCAVRLDAAELRKLTDDDLLKSFNDPADGASVLVTRDGTIMNGHHRIAELQRRMNDPGSTITPETPVRIDGYSRQIPSGGFWE